MACFADLDLTDVVFVFGSNLAGRHGKGAAKEALNKYGAIYGQGVGRQGQSYAIPTKDRHMAVLKLDSIRWNVWEFIQYAKANPDTPFFVTRIGCGLAGYEDGEIAPLFAEAPENCLLPLGWRKD